MNRFFQLLLIFGLCLGITVPAWAIQPTIPAIEQRYQPLLNDLQMTGIPLRLPTYVPAAVNIRRANNVKVEKAAAQLPVYAHLDEDTPNGYTITIGHTENCDGGNACRIGTVQAKRITKGTPRIDEQYAFMKPAAKFPGRRSEEAMGAVDLANGLQGYFVPWICGASCNDAKVVWDEGDYRYLVGIKVGDKAELIAMANSALQR